MRSIPVKHCSTLFNPKQSNVIVFVQSSNRAEKVGGRYKDIYFDDILPEIGPSFKIEKINNPNYLSHSRSALIPSDITTTGINLIIAGLLRTKSPGYLQDTAVMLSNLIETHLKLSSFTPERIRLRLTNFYWSKRVYSRLIKRIHPRCLLLTTAYLNNEIVAAAKEQSMTVIEFQHGHIRHYAGYSWSSYAIPYKSSMSTPDKIFLYGEYWSEEMRAYGFWDTELKTVGSLRLDQYRKISKEPGAHPLNLLLTTQNLGVDRLIDYISEFLALAEPA